MPLDGSISVFRQIIRDRPGILEDLEKWLFSVQFFNYFDLLNEFGAILVINFFLLKVILETLRLINWLI